MPCPPLKEQQRGGYANGSTVTGTSNSTGLCSDAVVYETTDAEDEDEDIDGCGPLQSKIRPPPQPSPIRVGTRAPQPDQPADGRFLMVEYDHFGFLVPPAGDALGDTARAYASWFAPKAQRRLVRFEARRRQLQIPGDWSNVPPKALKALLRKGVPAEHRSEVWWSVLGCGARLNDTPDIYRQRLGEELQGRTVEEIERDLPRTFPNNRTFRTEAGRSKLRNVLRAYACHVPRVRYCQGLNFIAALLLLVFLDEERAFWALVCAVETLGVEGYYEEGMKLLRADMRVLFNVIEKKCPKVSARLRAEGADLAPLCSEWYITWFSKCLPIPTIFRVWDALFFEGQKVLVRIAIGVFKRAESQVLSCKDFEAIMQQAKRWPGSMVEHNELLKASFRGVPFLRRRDLTQAREHALGAINAEDDAHKRRTEENRRLSAERAEQRRRKEEAKGSLVEEAIPDGDLLAAAAFIAVANADAVATAPPSDNIMEFSVAGSASQSVANAQIRATPLASSGVVGSD